MSSATMAAILSRGDELTLNLTLYDIRVLKSLATWLFLQQLVQANNK